MTKKYRSDAFAAIHEIMEALHEVGTIDKQTMRQFDEACLTPRKIQYLKRDRVCNPVTHILKAIEVTKCFSRGCKPRPAMRA